MPQAEELLAQVYFKIDDTNASEEVYDSLVSIEVDDNLLLPDTFRISLRDPGFKWADSDIFEVGKSVKIEAKVNGGTSTLMAGEITAIKHKFGQAAAPTLVIKGYDHSHRFHRNKRTKTYIQQTDSDIAQKIARECKLKAKIDNTREVHEYVYQDNKSDMEFLNDRAQRIGYRMYVENGTLYFCQKPEDERQIPVLEWGHNLTDFQASLTTAKQVTQVDVRGWDPKTKKEIIGKATTPQDTPKVGQQGSGGDTAKKAFNIDSKETVVDRTVSTQAEADALAQSTCDRLGNTFIKASGSCDGNPAVHAGAIVELKGIGQRFSGHYRITRAFHLYENSGYNTRFEISGHQANTLSQILAPKGKTNWHSLAVGIVTNNRDPDGLGRVKVRFPTLPGNEESHWARLVSPMAGNGRGFEFIPEVNDEVAVAFEHDDTNRPFILGALWNGVDKPPEGSDKIVNSSTGKVEKRIIKSLSGHIITFDDTQGKEKISLVDKTSKNSIEIDSIKNSLTIKADDKMEINTKSGHKILLDDTGGKIEVVDKTGSNSVKIDSMQNSVSVESGMKLALKAQMIDIEAGANMTIKANGMMTVESGGMGTVKSSGILTIQGSLVKIN